MRTPLYSPHSLSRPGKNRTTAKNSSEPNPYASLPYATYRRPAPNIPPSFPPPPSNNDFSSHHFQTFGRHECFAAPYPITSMSRPDLLMSQTPEGSWGPTSTTSQLIKGGPGTGLNLQISCISTQQQQEPLATRVSLSKERLAETRWHHSTFIVGDQDVQFLLNQKLSRQVFSAGERIHQWNRAFSQQSVR